MKIERIEIHVTALSERLQRIFSSGSGANLKAEQYRVQVTQAGTETQVNVLNKDGAAEASQTASRILALLHEQLK